MCWPFSVPGARGARPEGACYSPTVLFQNVPCCSDKETEAQRGFSDGAGTLVREALRAGQLRGLLWQPFLCAFGPTMWSCSRWHPGSLGSLSSPGSPAEAVSICRYGRCRGETEARGGPSVGPSSCQWAPGHDQVASPVGWVMNGATAVEAACWAAFPRHPSVCPCAQCS